MFLKILNNKNLITGRPVGPSCSMWADGRTDTHDEAVAFQNFVNALNNCVYHNFGRKTWNIFIIIFCDSLNNYDNF